MPESHSRLVPLKEIPVFFVPIYSYLQAIIGPIIASLRQPAEAPVRLLVDGDLRVSHKEIASSLRSSQ